MAFRGIQAETLKFQGFNGDSAEAYYTRRSASGRYPSVVVIHHFPGWAEWATEVVFKFAHHGYAAIAPSLYFRLGDGAAPEVVARARAAGGMPDDQVMGDVRGAVVFLCAQPNSNGKVGAICFCSGGRQAYLAACGSSSSMRPWTAEAVRGGQRSVEATEYSEGRADRVDGENLLPAAGPVRQRGYHPLPARRRSHRGGAQGLAKNYEFHRYDQAGHAFFAWYRPNYRPEAALDGWNKAFAFFERSLVAA